jgi:hypothetical protein
MASRPRWWHQLQASKDEAILAVDLYNRSAQQRQLEAFVVHMCLAWLKLLQAKAMRDGGDIFVRDNGGRRRRTADGDWLTKPMRVLMDELFVQADPVRLLVNYEKTLVTFFDANEGLSDELRFPLFVSTITDDAVEMIKAVRRRVPKAVLDYVQDFDAALDPDLVADQRYEFRIYLVPMTGPKTSADVAMSFVRLDELEPPQVALMERCRW